MMTFLNPLVDFFLAGQDFFHFPFLRWALIGTLLTSLMAGFLSPFIVAKRLSFAGEAIGHSTLVGLTLSYFFFQQQSPLSSFVLTLTITLLLVSFLAKGTLKQHIPQDSLTGIFLATSIALGVLLHHLLDLKQGDLLHFLFGNILFIAPMDVYLMTIYCLLTLFFFKKSFSYWIYDLFDPEGASLAGLPSTFMHFFFFFLLGIFIVLAIKLVGTVLMNTFLLIPGVYALRRATTVRSLFLHSISFSLFSCLLGLYLMNYFNTPAGATLALSQFCCLLLSLFSVRLIQRPKS
jgi:zinc transport system permease protein